MINFIVSIVLLILICSLTLSGYEKGKEDIINDICLQKEYEFCFKNNGDGYSLKHNFLEDRKELLK